MPEIREILHVKFSIDHVTLQSEVGDITIAVSTSQTLGAKMPYVNLKIAGNLTKEQKAKIVAEFTDTLKRIAHKPESYTYVVIEEVKFEDWAIGGQLLSD